MDHHPAAERISSLTQTLPRRGVPVDAELGRFSPLSAPERESIDTFLREGRPWALRQARRSYRHLPESLREQAVDRACSELRARAPRSLERRALSAELAERLTEALRHVHVGWCLNESSALLRREGTEPVQPEVRREGLSHFVDEGLGGLERAVLQLEIGAGRDTRTSRAALRLGPRQYAAHRQAGLSKLSDAIAAQVIGRACDQHVSGIVAAATGDKTAMDALSAGPNRCRYCAREAQGLRSVLHERLAVAPWPVVIKPAGLLLTKLGAAAALFGGKGAGGATALGAAGSSGATAAATVLAAAALATGTAAVIESGDDGDKQRSRAATQTAERSAPVAATKARTVGDHSPASKRAGAKARSASTGNAGAAGTSVRAQRNNGSAGAAAPVAAPTGGGGSDAGLQTPSAQAPDTPAPAPADQAPSTPSGPVSSVARPVTDTVQGVTDQVTDTLPPTLGETVDATVEQLNSTVDDVTQTVDGLLKPRP